MEIQSQHTDGLMPVTEHTIVNDVFEVFIPQIRREASISKDTDSASNLERKWVYFESLG